MIQFNFKCLQELADFIRKFDGILLSSFVGGDNEVSHVDHNIKKTLEKHLKEVEKELITNKEKLESQHDVEAFVTKYHSWVDKISIAIDESIKDKETFIKENQNWEACYSLIDNPVSCVPQYDFIHSIPARLRELNESLFESTVILNPNFQATNPVRIKGLVVTDIFILSHVLTRVAHNTGLDDIERKKIVELLRNSIVTGNGTVLGPNTTYDGKPNSLTKKRMTRLAQLFYDAGNLLDEEIKNGIEKHYFSKDSKT